MRRLGLALAHRQNAGAHNLGDESSGVDDKAEGERDKFRQQTPAAVEIELAHDRWFDLCRSADGEEGEQR